ncbi:hypothetical protein L3X38_007571 [Prunus dulcis]|uniref:Uncharacterized protein n=1 Tax=Prunus dulcis TaxID=3755 RepID=A0AAD5F618_PRUDU|nr:hypothetical protein L3X38_007571 [Prunus dulcis]
MAPPPQSQRSSSPSQPSGKGEVADVKSQLRNQPSSRAPGVDDSKRELFKKVYLLHDNRQLMSLLSLGEMVIVFSNIRYRFEENVLSLRWEVMQWSIRTLHVLTINFLKEIARMRTQ